MWEQRILKAFWNRIDLVLHCNFWMLALGFEHSSVLNNVYNFCSKTGEKSYLRELPLFLNIADFNYLILLSTHSTFICF